MTKCPVCGADTARIEARARGGFDPGALGFERTPSATFAQGAPVVAPGSTWERRRPVGQPRVADVKAAAGWSVGSALALSAAGVGLALVTWSLEPAAWGAGAGVVVGVGVWFAQLAQSRRLLWLVERVSGRDLDGDGVTGRPAQAVEPRTVRAEVIERTRNHARVRFVDLPVNDDKLEAVARAVIRDGAAFSRPELCTRRGLLSQNEYRELADAMIRAGLLFDLAGNKRELSAAGRALLRELVGD